METVGVAFPSAGTPADLESWLHFSALTGAAFHSESTPADLELCCLHFFKCFFSNPLHSGDNFFFGPREDTCLTANESREAFRRNPVLSELEAWWAIASLHCCPFLPSFVCQGRAASALRVGRWLYRTPQAHIEEDRILKLSVCLCTRDGVQEPTSFKQERGHFKTQETWGKSHRNNGALQQAERENMNNSFLYGISHLRVPLSALVYCGNILWAMLLLPLHGIDWTLAISAGERGTTYLIVGMYLQPSGPLHWSWILEKYYLILSTLDL